MIATQLINAAINQGNKGKKLFDELVARGFHQIQTLHIEDAPQHASTFVQNKIYYWKKNGDCIVCMLRDGRILVIYGPTGMWQLVDELNALEMQALDAFCSLGADDQMGIRQSMIQSGIALRDVFQAMVGKQGSCFQNFILAWYAALENDCSVVMETTIGYGKAQELLLKGLGLSDSHIATC